MALKFSMILEAIDRASAPAKRAQATVARLTGTVRQSGQQVARASRQMDDGAESIEHYGQRAGSSFGRIGAAARRWGRDVQAVSRDIETGARSIEHYERRARRLRQVALGTFFRAAGNDARRFGATLRNGLDAAYNRSQRFNASIRAGIRNLDLMGRAGKAAGSGLRWMGGKALGAAKWAAAGATAAGGLATFDMLKTAGQFEQYQVMLEGTEGSAKRARQAMAWVQKFAQTTPYELEQVMEAFVALKAYGIDPMNGSLQSLGDGASGMSKDIMQAVEALADAMTGEYERLKEFGIRASKAGDKVTFTYRKNGQDIKRTVKATGSEVEKSLKGIFSDRFGGGMVRQSKTLFGIISNIKDAWSGFLLMVANAGIFDRVKAKLAEWQARLGTMAQDGRLRQWAEKISNRLSEAFDWAVKFVEGVNWGAVGTGLATAITALVRIIELVGQAITKFERFQAYRAASMAENTENGWFSSDGSKAAARSQRQAVERRYGPLTQTGRNEKAQADQAAGQASNARLRRDIDRIRNRRWQRALSQPQGGAGNWTRLPAASAKPKPAGPTKIGGALDINVKVEGGGTARVQRVATVNRNVPIRANVGKVMGAPA